MIGIGAIKTVQDIDNYMAVDKEGTKALIQQIIDNRFIWREKGPVSKDKAKEDDEHKVIIRYNDDDIEKKNPIYIQLVKEEDGYSKMVQLGISLKNLKKYLNA